MLYIPQDQYGAVFLGKRIQSLGECTPKLFLLQRLGRYFSPVCKILGSVFAVVSGSSFFYRFIKVPSLFPTDHPFAIGKGSELAPGKDVTFITTGIMSANPDIKLMVTDHGNLTGTVQTFLEAAGKKPGEVYAAGFDMSGNAVTAIKGGWLQLVIDQQHSRHGSPSRP